MTISLRHNQEIDSGRTPGQEGEVASACEEVFLATIGGTVLQLIIEVQGCHLVEAVG